MSKKEKILLLILSGINFAHIMDFMIMLPMGDFLYQAFKISPQQFSFIVSAYAFSAFFSSMTASFLIDRFDRKIVLQYIFVGFIIGTFACAFASTYETLIIARIITGIFGGLISAQVLSIVGDVFPYERRGEAMGMLMSAFSVAVVAGVPIGLYFASKYSWHFPFIGIGVMGLALLPLVVLYLPRMNHHLQSQQSFSSLEIYRSILSNRSQQMGLLMMFTLILSNFATVLFIAPYLENNVGFTKDQIVLMYFFGGAVTLFSSPQIGKISDKFGKQRIFSLFMILFTIPVYLITNMPRISAYYVLIITTLFFIISGGRTVPAQAMLTAVVPPQIRGGFMNLSSSMQQLGVGLATLIAGAIVKKNALGQILHYEIIGYLGIAVSFLCLFVSKKVRPLEEK